MISWNRNLRAGGIPLLGDAPPAKTQWARSGVRETLRALAELARSHRRLAHMPTQVRAHGPIGRSPRTGRCDASGPFVVLERPVPRPTKKGVRDDIVESSSDGHWRPRTSGSLDAMPTLVLDPQPHELAALIERRRRLGQDLFDEVWQGVLHMNPAPRGRHGAIETQLAVLLTPLARGGGLVLTGQFNVGSSEEDYRVPDLGLHREFSDRVWYPSALLVVEIVSPGDESYKKFDFYAAHGVDEVVIIDPGERVVHWFSLGDGEYRELERSAVLASGPTELARQIDWP